MRRIVFMAAGLAAVAVAGCSSSGSGSPASSASSSASSTGSITVFAAASLMGTFTQLGKQFDAAHPGDTVKFSFGPSSGLSTQITSGAPADVFASAAPANMDTVVKAGDAANPQDFAKNTMEVAVPPNNPGKVTSVTDLAQKSVKVVARQPGTEYVAKLVGLNLYSGHASGSEVVLDTGGTFVIPGQGRRGDVLVAVRPSAVVVSSQRPQLSSARNIWPAKVTGLTLLADRVRLNLEGQPSALVDVTPAAVAELSLDPGSQVWLTVKATDLEVYAHSERQPA